MKHFLMTLIAVATMSVSMSPVWAQEMTTPAKKAGETENMPGMDHSQMDHSKMGHGNVSPPKEAAKSDMGKDGGMVHGAMQGGSPPPDARDPHAYSDSYDFGPISRPRMGDEENFGSLLVDQLDSVHTRDNTSTAYELQGWLGRVYDRVVLKAEGVVDGGKLEEARTELLWGHAVAAFWDMQLGVRYDSGENPERKWLAFGIQGLAPYWFQVDTAVYLGEGRRSALRLDVEYELLLTQRLILQPKIEINFYGKSDAARGLGSGLSEVSVALRLRYEIRREFAPYVGIEWASKFGGTADFAHYVGKDTHETRLVAGVRFWF